MDIPTILSRRSLLKASAFLAIACTTPATAAAIADNEVIPAVLTMLLTEYSASQGAQAAAREAYRNAEREFDQALSEKCLSAPYQCGTGSRAPWIGHLYSGSVDPWTAKHRLDNYRDAAMVRAKASGDPAIIDGIRRDNRNLSRRLARQITRYEAIKKAMDIPVLDDARTTAYNRALDATEALQAYRPTSFAEVREIVRVVRVTPSYGSSLEWILVSMLEIEPAGAP